MPRKTDIKMRKGTAAAWTSANPVLAAGEPGFETDTKKLKFGDGTTAWNSLPYFHVDGGELVGGNSPTPTPTDGDSCPAPEMKILLADGSSVIAGDLKPGMNVRTNHEETMELGSYEVTHVSVVTSNRLKMKIGDVDFVCSESHKFYMNGSWHKAESLKEGDVVSGKVVSNIEKLGSGDVVKITVDSAHTYICEGLLSHNKSQLPSTPTPTATPAPTATPYVGMMNPKSVNISW